MSNIDFEYNYNPNDVRVVHQPSWVEDIINKVDSKYYLPTDVKTTEEMRGRVFGSLISHCGCSPIVLAAVRKSNTIKYECIYGKEIYQSIIDIYCNNLAVGDSSIVKFKENRRWSDWLYPTKREFTTSPVNIYELNPSMNSDIETFRESCNNIINTII